MIANRTWENHAKKFMVEIEEVMNTKKIDKSKQKAVQSRRFWRRYKDVSSS
ncbi:MAG: hypothetical protein ACTSP5_09120 [Candidatus Heimdallarchaeota archaeon]